MLAAFAIALTVYGVSAHHRDDQRQRRDQNGGAPGRRRPPHRIPIRRPGRRVFGLPASRPTCAPHTMMSAVFGAGRVALVLRLLVELGLFAPRRLRGAMVYGSTYTFWSSALRAESTRWPSAWRCWRSGAPGRPALRTHRPLAHRRSTARLTLTGHLAFALPVTALGLAARLAAGACEPAASSRARGPRAAFLVRPHALSLPGVGRHASHTMDFLRYVDLGFFPLGPRPDYFDTPWERVWWPESRHATAPPQPVVIDPAARHPRGHPLGDQLASTSPARSAHCWRWWASAGTCVLRGGRRSLRRHVRAFHRVRVCRHQRDDVAFS